MKKKDYITILSIILLIIFCFVIRSYQNKGPGQYVKLVKDKETFGIYPLNKDDTINLGSNTLTIKDGKAKMTDADCPDKLCISQSSISNSGEQIVCLPNKISATIISSMDPISKSGFYFNTYVTISLYDSKDEKILDECLDLCNRYEAICSRTNPDSELYKLNHRLTNPIDNNSDSPARYPLSKDLYKMIEAGLKYSHESDDSFNIAIAGLSDLWNFSSSEEIIPEDEAIKEALKYTKSSDIILNNDGTISFSNDRVMIDLGGLAKGYIADRIKEYLISQNVSSATIALGGNILCIGDKLGNPFTIGIQKPFAANGQTIDTVSVRDKSVVTSGIYERYFKKNDKIYHHILDSKTGYPIKNDIYGITVISNSSLDGDCLSTMLFSMGSEKAIEYANENPEIDIIIVTNENKIIRSR